MSVLILPAYPSTLSRKEVLRIVEVPDLWDDNVVTHVIGHVTQNSSLTNKEL